MRSLAAARVKCCKFPFAKNEPYRFQHGRSSTRGCGRQKTGCWRKPPGSLHRLPPMGSLPPPGYLPGSVPGLPPPGSLPPPAPSLPPSTGSRPLGGLQTG
ncbi:hypothetical protein CHARACLAT_012339 [Characodon lateralis]|uniref:Uncharacterized protein n=1 Tax=Characodon lateralis TaxID=208331 RepID=A0ABU7E1G9_9TELE|nr:hypothetical protein [Characodon lateralis]